MKSDIEIAQNIKLQPIENIAAKIDMHEKHLIKYGNHIAKVPFTLMEELSEKPDGNLVLVTAMTPTSMGEGKTTNTIGLGQALSKLGKKTMIAIREPSLGPCMGVKGGAAGGGYSQVLPMEDINLHFTGDIHAVTTAHNLLSSIIDNHVHQKNTPELNSRQVVWKRVIDMNDRALRSIMIGMGEKGGNGVLREDGFEITAASEIMAILCLSKDLKDLKERVGNIIVGYDSLKKPVYVKELGVEGAMTALLKHAVNPNLVQTVEGTPVFVHGGPFANIAHGCNTLFATRMAMKYADYVITEAGFAADLGAEKFFDIKCRIGGLKPRAVVLVVTKRAYDIHGIENIKKHADNLKLFNVPVCISINKFLDDSDIEISELHKKCNGTGVPSFITDFREKGGEGGPDIAAKLVDMCNNDNKLQYIYDLESGIKEKITEIATKIYGAKDVDFSGEAENQIKRIENIGYKNIPVCMAKTQSSLSDNPKLTGCPKNFTLNVNSARVSSGAGFVVAYTGKIMTMPGLPRIPSAMNIDIDDNGNISGLF